jgi:hypothetical protein
MIELQNEEKKKQNIKRLLSVYMNQETVGIE